MKDDVILRISRINVIFLFLIISFEVNAQNNLPVIRADSKVVDIMDGENFKKGWWQIMPERKPDIYYVSIPHKPHRVIFRTDIDSIAFDTKYGETYDFIIALKNGDSCRTRIIAKERELLNYISSPKSVQPIRDTIPIRVGDNSKIYITGKINGSPSLNFQFDLGCGGSIIKKGSIDKVRMSFDGKTFLINSDGRNEVPTSSRNTLKLGSMKWNENITFIVGDNMDKGEDGLLGNGLFLDKVIEINYDKKVMIVHDSLPMDLSGFEKQSFILDGVIPYIKASIGIGKDCYTDWYMFDTGYSGLLRISKDLNDKYDLSHRTENAFNPFKKTLILPKIKIGNHDFNEIRTIVHPALSGSRTGILGNVLLKRFNVILDNQNGFVYLKPNHLMKTQIKHFNMLYFLLVVPILLIIIYLVWWMRRRTPQTNKK